MFCWRRGVEINGSWQTHIVQANASENLIVAHVVEYMTHKRPLAVSFEKLFAVTVGLWYISIALNQTCFRLITR